MRFVVYLVLVILPVVAAGQAPGGVTPEGLLQRAKQVLAQVEGELTVAGLKAPVEVRRDRWGVPHIYAQNADDLFFAQGLVAAQDRLFQIELWRRHAAGEMAEILGPAGLESDRFARLIRYRGSMKAEWASYSPDTQAIATAFTRGINAWIDHLGDRLPIEFQMLGFRPKRWRPEDVLGRMSGIYMSQNFRNEVARARLVAAVGIEKARWLAPVDPPREYESALPLEELKRIDERVLAGYLAATKLLQFTPPRTESNNWVVGGHRSNSGKPLLASDPHRAIALPALRYIVHLHAPGWNVIGAGEPALPGVALGHNEHIAWGITIIGADQSDIYVEETHPEDPRRYKVGDRWEQMKVVTEEVHIKGKKDPEKIELRYTRHGPVLHQEEKSHRAYALKWAGHEPGGAAYLGGLAVARARDRNSFLQALRSWKVPGLNFVYADVQGEIGWIANALVPVRAKHDGLLPVPGNGGFEWQRFLTVEEMPQQWNPRSGILATANHKILPEGFRHIIGFEFAPPYRYLRLRTALSAQKKWDIEDFRALQHDDVSLPALALCRLLRQLDLRDATLEPHARMLQQWDGKLEVNAQAGPLYALWFREVQEAVHGQHVGKELRSVLATLSGPPVLLRALEEADPRWFGPEAKGTRNQLLRATFAAAVAKWKKLPENERQRWGALHTVTFRHPLTTLSPAHERAFNVGPFERPGESNTPNNTRYDEKFKQIHGATYRQLLDLADWDRGLATSAPGQSGQPGSPHYADLAPLWARGEYFPLAFSRPKVEEVTRHRLVLNPAGK